MVCKLVFVFLALACASQVLATPVTRDTKFPVPLQPKYEKNLFTDILAAVASVEHLIEEVGSLVFKIENLQNEIIIDIVFRLDDIILGLIKLEVPQEKIDGLNALVDIAVSDLKAILTNELANLGHVGELLVQLIDNLLFDHDQIRATFDELLATFEKFGSDFTSGVDKVVADAVNIYNEFVAVINSLEGEGAEQIRDAWNGLVSDLIGEYNSIIQGFNDVIASAEAVVAAVEKVLSHFKRLHL